MNMEGIIEATERVGEGRGRFKEGRLRAGEKNRGGTPAFYTNRWEGAPYNPISLDHFPRYKSLANGIISNNLSYSSVAFNSPLVRPTAFPLS